MSVLWLRVKSFVVDVSGVLRLVISNLLAMRWRRCYYLRCFYWRRVWAVFTTVIIFVLWLRDKSVVDGFRF